MKRWMVVIGSAVLMAQPTFANDQGRVKARACAVCHGNEGLSTNPAAPSLAGQPQNYLAEQLKHYRSGKRENPVMNVIAKPLTDADISDLAGFYSSFQIEIKK